MLESYVRDAPKRHELYQRNFEMRRYACREYGGICGEWLLGEALEGNGHALSQSSMNLPDEKDNLGKVTSRRPALSVSNPR